MTALLLAMLLVAGQDPPTDGPEPAGPPPPAGAVDDGLYHPPGVRPYEMPPSVAEGLSVTPPEPPVVTEPVQVNAYVRSYEGVTDALDQRFQIGLESARLAVDATAGPLDGRWTLVDHRDRAMLRLVLADPAPGGLVEGAWRSLTAPEGARASGFVGATERDGEAVRLEVADGVLTLTPRDGAWLADWVTPNFRLGGRLERDRVSPDAG
jgi:hypothetical protein